jgi:hypothetical protein
VTQPVQNNNQTVIVNIQRTNWAGVLGMICGLFALPLSFIPIFGLASWLWLIPGLILSACGRYSDRNSGTALAGLVMNGLALAVCSLWACGTMAAVGGLNTPNSVSTDTPTSYMPNSAITPRMMPTDATTAPSWEITQPTTAAVPKPVHHKIVRTTHYPVPTYSDQDSQDGAGCVGCAPGDLQH